MWCYWPLFHHAASDTTAQPREHRGGAGVAGGQSRVVRAACPVGHGHHRGAVRAVDADADGPPDPGRPSVDQHRLSQLARAEHPGDHQRPTIERRPCQPLQDRGRRQQQPGAVDRPREAAVGVSRSRGLGDRAVQQQRVDERLGQVAAQLALGDVELLGEQPRRAAGGAVALEPARGARPGRPAGA